MIPTMDEFKKAQTIKINPDKPQEQARYLTIDVSSRETANIFSKCFYGWKLSGLFSIGSVVYNCDLIPNDILLKIIGIFTVVTLLRQFGVRHPLWCYSKITFK